MAVKSNIEQGHVAISRETMVPAGPWHLVDREYGQMKAKLAKVRNETGKSILLNVNGHTST